MWSWRPSDPSMFGRPRGTVKFDRVFLLLQPRVVSKREPASPPGGWRRRFSHVELIYLCLLSIVHNARPFQ